jgi:flagellar biosynthesis GTPase FlhF
MFVKKFEGESLDEALQAVKRELGPDAIILKTVTNKGLKGAFKKSRIEITAAISEQSYEKKSRVDHVLTGNQQEEFYNAPASRVNNMINEYDEHRPAKQEVSARTGGYGNMGLNKVVSSVSNKIKNSLDDFLAIEDEAQTPKNTEFDSFLSSDENHSQAPQRGHQEMRASAQELDAYTATEHQSEEFEDNYRTENLIEANRVASDEASSELRQEIKSQKHQIDLLEQKLFEISERFSEQKQDHTEPRGIKGLRSTLRSLELSEALVQKILKKATFELTHEQLDDADLIYDFALREMNGMVNVGMPLFSNADIQESPVVTVLLSENSCGQSSMAMKLAVLQDNVKIIKFRERSIDMSNSEFTARIFKLDIANVNTLSHLMSEARKAIQDNRSIILDLRLNFQEANESKKFIETLKRSFDQVEFLVTMSAINSELYNRKILSKYNQYADGVIISYIDQCLSFGSLVNVHTEYSQLPLKFFGTGATVPDDIEAATAERILAGMFQL